MASRKFELEIDLKSKKAEKDLKKFNKTLDDTNKKTKENKDGNKKAKGGLAGFVGGLSTGTKVLGGIGIALTAATTAVLAMNTALVNSAKGIRELETMAKVGDTTVATMQAMAIESEKFGVSGEKMADIMQDVNDKLFDFIENDAGAFKDFMAGPAKAINLTAEALLGLSGPEKIIKINEAIAAYGQGAESAAFHTEGLGSDLNRVLSIADDAGKSFKETAARLKALGATVNPETSKIIKEYADEVRILEEQWNTLSDSILAKVQPAMLAIIGSAQEFVAWMQGNVAPNKTIAQLREDLVEVNELIKETGETITVGSFRGAKGAQVKNPAIEEREKIQQRINALLKQEDEAATAAEAKRTAAAKAVAAAEARRLETKNKLEAAEAKIRSDIEGGLQTRLRLANDLNGSYEFGLDVARDMVTANKDELEYLRLKLVLEDKEVENAHLLLDLLKKTQEVENAAAQSGRFASKEQALKRELELLRATTDEQRQRLAFEHELFDLDLSGNQKQELTAINNQIIAREKYLALLDKEKDAVKSLAEAMGNWASGSKDAIKQVYAQLLKLIILKATGGSGGAFMSGFLDGFGSGGLGGYAKGGQFNAGETFMVGEQGPEIITASAPGSVIPNHKLGGGTGISISPQLVINGGVNNADELSAVLSNFSNEIASQTQHLIKTQLGPRGVFA